MHGINCNFCEYYTQQAGSGFPIYKGLPHQRGYGLFSNIFKRYGIPLLKYLGKTGFQLGKQVGEDIFVNKENPKAALQRRLKGTAKNVAFDALGKVTEKVSQLGSGARRPKRKTKRRVTKRKPAKKSSPRKKPAKRKTTRKATIKTVRQGDIFGY